MTLNESLAAELTMESAKTRAMIERLPMEFVDWAPHEKSMPMGPLTSHIVRLLGWTAMTINTEAYDMALPGNEPPTGKETSPLESLLEMLDKNTSEGVAALKGCDKAHLMENWALRSGDTEFFNMPRVAVLRNFVLNHLIHHRGQLGVYFRMKDVALPAIYGPSADEEM